MPDPARTRRTPTPTPDEPAGALDKKPTGPLWARAVHHFYDPIFDIRSSKAFQSALNDFVLLPADERAFHETHLLYRLVLGLEGLHGVLVRIEKRLDATANPDLAALEHLEPIRAALEEIASNQPSLLQVEGWDGREHMGDQDDEEEDPDALEEDEDPDFIYDTVPDEEPEQPRRTRRPAPAEAARPQPQRAEAPRPEPPRAAEPDRDALVGDLVPASEGPQGDGAGDR